jgi:hypothetical protein
VLGSWYDKWSATWLGCEMRDQPGRPLATRGATGLRRGGHRMRRHHRGCHGAGDSTRRRCAGEATAFRLAVLHRIDPSVAVSSDGGGAGPVSGAGSASRVTLPFQRPIRMRAEHQNLGGPHFRASISGLRSHFFCTCPQIPGSGLIWGLGWSCSKDVLVLIIQAGIYAGWGVCSAPTAIEDGIILTGVGRVPSRYPAASCYGGMEVTGHAI